MGEEISEFLDRRKIQQVLELLAVPELKKRYLGYVKDIAENWLDWEKLGPLARKYHDLIDPLVKIDTRNLDSYEAFRKSLDGEFEARGGFHAAHFAKRPERREADSRTGILPVSASVSEHAVARSDTSGVSNAHHFARRFRGAPASRGPCSASHRTLLEASEIPSWMVWPFTGFPSLRRDGSAASGTRALPEPDELRRLVACRHGQH